MSSRISGRRIIKCHSCVLFRTIFPTIIKIENVLVICHLDFPAKRLKNTTKEKDFILNIGKRNRNACDEINLNRINELSIGLNQLLNQINNELQLCEKRLQNVPDGTLNICGTKGKTQYYNKLKDGNKVYVSKKQQQKIFDLAQKEYDLILLNELRNQQKQLQQIIASFHPEKLDETFQKFCEAKKLLINPIITSDKKYVEKWLKKEYNGLGFEESDESDFITTNGIRVRSKSEVMIAETLNRYKIPYRYEYPLILDGIGIVHPDFFCLNVRKRKEVVWEHFGMMDDMTYSSKNIKKMEKYVINGYIPGDNFISTYETNNIPLSSRVIEKMIKMCLI